MTSRHLILFLAAVNGLCFSAVAAEEAITCPPRFPMNALQFGAGDDGWTAGPGDSAAPLESVGLFSGPPSERAQLVPTSSNGTRVTWELDEPIPGGVWLQCTYGRQSLTLSRPLRTAPTVCVATYGKERAFQPRPIDFRCR